MRPLLTAAGVVLAAGSILSFIRLDPDSAPDALAYAEQNAEQPDMGRVARLSGEALREDPANAIRWADFGEKLDDTGDASRAAYAFERGSRLSVGAPQVLLRYANHLVLSGDTEKAAGVAARVLEISPAFDDAVFGVFGRYPNGPRSLAASLRGNARALKTFVRYLAGAKRFDVAAPVWDSLKETGLVDRDLARSYIDGLISAGDLEQAARTASDYLRGTSGDLALLYNGGFEAPMSGLPFDWKIEKFVGGEATVSDSGHGGSHSLQVRFTGTSNVADLPVGIWARLAPGHYVLRYWMKADGLTTDEGPRVELSDIEQPKRLSVGSAAVVGTVEWTPVEVPFVVPTDTRVVGIQLSRHPSLHFDNKIAGTFWIDDVEILPTPGPGTNAPQSHDLRTTPVRFLVNSK